ncbi:immunoglobulin kappa light chain-like [Scleropages formosus]|uniref:immunoglobulin kappa light chain-like n=1 Tax=Scleropages formosus TaxID=113540 RepID=UPI000878929E|nr:immunoglobulin kappa light chain-like [Scleropages formosus]
MELLCEITTHKVNSEDVTQGDDVVQPHPVLAVRVGERVTLQCFCPNDDMEYTFWLKLNVGQIPLLIATSLKFSSDAMFYNNFNSTRFQVKTGVGLNHLTISNIESSDSAMYYCGMRKDYSIVFGAGTYLVIKGKQPNSMTVVEQPVSDPVHPGDSVTLQCTVDSETCAGEHSVYWFRHGSGESLPGLIYTHGNRSDECEKSPEAGSHTHSCVYSLPKRNLSRSDAGIYYCAVVTCGDILFGNGTQLEFNDHSVDPLILVQAVSLGFCVIFIAVLLCTRNKNCRG